MIRRIIFLDMDGVLLPFPPDASNQGDLHDDNNSSPRLFPSSTLRPLKRLWKHITGIQHQDSSVDRHSQEAVEWVLSSTWRVQESYIRDIERALQEFGISLKFSDITDPKMHSERQWEIQDWLQRNINYSDDNSKVVWLALDDEELLDGDKNAQHRGVFQGHVICTKSHLGLSDYDVDKAIRFWDQQLKEISE